MFNLQMTIGIFSLCIVLFFFLGGTACRILRVFPTSYPDANNQPRTDFWLISFFVLSLGISTVILCTAALVLLGVLSVPMLFGILGVLSCFATWDCIRPGGWGRPMLALGAWPQWLTLAMLCAVLIPQSLHVPGLCDDTMYHLVQSRVFFETGNAAVYPYVRFQLFPVNMEMLNVLAFAVFGPNTPNADTLAQLLASFPFTVICLGLLGISKWKCASLIPGMATIAIMMFVQPVMSTLGYAYVELGTMLFCFGLTLAVLLAFERPELRLRWLGIAGILAGMACGTKYFGLAYAGFAGIMLCLTLREVRGIFVFGLTAVGLGCWWYVRSFVISGDPVHPFGGPIFGYYLWTAADVLNQLHEQASHGVARSVLAIWPALLKAEVAPLALAPLVLLFRKRFGPGLVFAFGTVLAYFFLWLYATQVARYLAIILPMGLFFGAFGLWHALTAWLPARPQRFLGAHSLNAGLALLLPVLLAYILHSSSIYTNKPKDFSQIFGHELIQKANEVMAATGKRKLMEMWYGNLDYFCTGIMVGDDFGPYNYGPMYEHNPEADPKVDPITVRLPHAQSVIKVMRERDCELFVVNTRSFPLTTGYDTYFTVIAENPHGVLLQIREDIP